MAKGKKLWLLLFLLLLTHLLSRCLEDFDVEVEDDIDGDEELAGVAGFHSGFAVMNVDPALGATIMEPTTIWFQSWLPSCHLYLPNCLKNRVVASCLF